MTGFVNDIEKSALDNTDFRRVIFTGKHAQLVLMHLKPNEEIGREAHTRVDQFFRVEAGRAKFIFNDTEEHLVDSGSAVVVPAGTVHNVVNASSTEPLKMYTIYSPPQHAGGTVHKTRAEAAAAEQQKAHNAST